MIYNGKLKRLEIYLNDKPPYLTMAQVKAKTRRGYCLQRLHVQHTDGEARL